MPLERRRRRRTLAGDQAAVASDVHIDLAQSLVPHHDLVDRQGVEQLVREEHAFEIRREPRSTMPADRRRRRAFRRCAARAAGAGLDEMKACALVETRGSRRRAARRTSAERRPLPAPASTRSNATAEAAESAENA